MVTLKSLVITHSIVEDKTPLPPPKEDSAEEEALFAQEPTIEPPIRIDYGFNVKLGEGVFINSYCVIIDTCLVTVGARTLFGPNVNLYSGTHPLDPAVRNGIKGPETGKEIHIGEDCWIAGNVTILPGVTVGRGATVGAGSVVTKVLTYLSSPTNASALFFSNPAYMLTTETQDVPAFHVVAGNPAKVIRKIETSMTE